VASLEGLVGVMADIEAHPGVVKVLFQDGASSSSELFKEDTAVSEILEHLGCQGGALKRADGLKYIGSNVVPAGVYQLVRPAPPPGGVVGTSISLTDLLKSRYNTWIVNTKSDSSHQRKYPGLQLGIWNLDKDEVAAYLGDKLGTKTMAASEDPRFKGPFDVLESESQCNFAFKQCVGNVVAAVLQQAGLGVYFAVDPAAAPDSGKPDFVVGEGQRARRLLVVGEGKTPRVMAAAHEIVGHTHRQVQLAAEQACSYIKDKDLRYGFLTYLNGTFFIKRLKENTYLSSSVVLPDALDLSAAQLMAYVILKALDEGVVWSGDQEEGACLVDPHQQQRPGMEGKMSGQQGSVMTRQRTQQLAAQKAGASGAVFCSHPVEALKLTSSTLGAGQTGPVRLAWFLGTPCAVKMVDTSKDWELQRVLENEVEAYGLLSALQGDVIPVLEGCGFWKDENVFFVATSLVDGDHPGSSSRAGLPAAEEALRKIHALGLLHGDIKEENILLRNNDGAWKVWYLDLGLSRLSSSADDFAEEVAELRAVFRASQQSDATDEPMTFQSCCR